MLIDSHCHLNFDELYNGLDYYMNLMLESNVRYALCVGTRPDVIDRILEICQKYNNIFASIGVHPDENIIIDEKFFIKYLVNSKVIAIGETGLDYYRISKKEDNNLQIDKFFTHINVAKENNLPLIIHTRNSINETINVLKNYGDSIKAVMHCFTESIEYARQCLDFGYYISISGIVTFKNAGYVKDLATYVPLDRLLIETDAPFLAPVPFRGKINHPALLSYTAECIANLRNISMEEIQENTSRNFFTLFNKAKVV